MMLAGSSFEQVKALIDRGIAADKSFPAGRAYLLSTQDKARNVHAAYFELTAKELAGVFPIEILETGAIEDRHDVLFYFIGLPQVPQLKTLDFLPGALADNLTSFGGQHTDSSQMSSLRWLEAGATASYGTVMEPCNHPQKFPFPAVAMFHYASGASSIEAYWKSVAWPGEGLLRIENPSPQSAHLPRQPGNSPSNADSICSAFSSRKMPAAISAYNFPCAMRRQGREVFYPAPKTQGNNASDNKLQYCASKVAGLYNNFRTPIHVPTRASPTSPLSLSLERRASP